MDPVAHRKDAVALFFGAALSFVAHAVLLFLFFFATNIQHESDEGDQEALLPVVSAELLMLGDVMPEDGELPWIANPEEAPLDDAPPTPTPVPEEEETTLPQQETVVIEQEEAPAEPVREENRAQPEEHRPDRAARQDRGETNPNRPTNDRPRVGSPDGFEGGTSLSAAALQNQFAGLVRQLSRGLRRPSGITDQEFRSLEALVHVRCTEAGRITAWEFVDRSGNRLFDSAVESMLNRFRLGSDRLNLGSVTNDELRQRMIRDGFRIPVRGS